MKIAAALLLASLAAGCAPTIKMSNPRSVVVHAGGVASASRVAEQECSKHGRVAQFNQERPEFVFTFACVE